ncbi:LTS8 protein [Aphelenchoides avenae]|nr:LTS8 protein [Aphelenchus avenae]
MAYGRPILVSASQDTTIRFWDAGTQRQLECIPHKESQVNEMCITPDGAQLVVAGWQHVRMYDMQCPTQQGLHTFGVHDKNVTCLGFQADGAWMYTGGEDCTAKIWDMRANQLTCQRIFQVNTTVHSVALHPNQVELIVADSTGALYLWDLRSDRDDSLVTEVDMSEHIVHCEIDRTGRQCAAVTNRGHLFFWNIMHGLISAQAAPIPTIAPPMGVATAPPAIGILPPLGAPPDQLQLPTVEPQITMMSSARPCAKIRAHNTFALKCHFRPDSLAVATTSADQTTRLWSVTHHKMLQSYGVPDSKWVWDCAFTNDSEYMVTASSDAQLRMWELKTGKVVRTYQGHSMSITAMAFRDMARLA